MSEIFQFVNTEKKPDKPVIADYAVLRHSTTHKDSPDVPQQELPIGICFYQIQWQNTIIFMADQRPLCLCLLKPEKRKLLRKIISSAEALSFL